MDVAQRVAHVADRVNHVGAENEVKATRLELLRGAGFLQIECFEFHFGKGRELLPCRREECGGNIAEDVGLQPVGNERKHLRRESAGAGPDFQNAQSTPLGMLADDFFHGPADGSEPRAGDQPIAVKLIQQLRAAAGEEDLNGILLAPHDGSEIGTGRAADEGFGQMARILSDARAEHLGRGSRSRLERGGRPVTAAIFDEQLLMNQVVRQLLERQAHAFRHTKRLPREFANRAHFAQAVCDLSRGELVARRAGGIEVFPSAHVQDFIQRLLRDHLQVAQRHRWMARCR